MIAGVWKWLWEEDFCSTLSYYLPVPSVCPASVSSTPLMCIGFFICQAQAYLSPQSKWGLHSKWVNHSYFPVSGKPLLPLPFYHPDTYVPGWPVCLKCNAIVEKQIVNILSHQLQFSPATASTLVLGFLNLVLRRQSQSYFLTFCPQSSGCYLEYLFQ